MGPPWPKTLLLRKFAVFWEAMVMRLLHELLRAIRKMPRSWLPLHDKRQVLYRDEINRAWSNAVT